MGAAVTKYSTDEKGFYHFTEVCPSMNVNGAGTKCGPPAESSEEDVKKMADRKYYLVGDPVANPAMGSMLPFPVTDQGFFLDTMDHETKKELSSDPEALKKAVYYMTTQRDPRVSDAKTAATMQVPGTWCAHMKPCPSGVPCCPEVAPAVPVLATNQVSSTIKAVKSLGSSLKDQLVKLILVVLFVLAIYFAYKHFSKSQGGTFRRGAATSPPMIPRTSFRNAGFEV